MRKCIIRLGQTKMEKWENCAERDQEVWKVGLKVEKNQSKNLTYYFPIRRPNSKVRIELVKVFRTLITRNIFQVRRESHTVWKNMKFCLTEFFPRESSFATVFTQNFRQKIDLTKKICVAENFSFFHTLQCALFSSHSAVWKFTLTLFWQKVREWNIFTKLSESKGAVWFKILKLVRSFWREHP